MLGISATGAPGRKFFDELVRLDWSTPDRCETHRLPEGRFFGGEPALVPGPQSQEDVVDLPRLRIPLPGARASDVFSRARTRSDRLTAASRPAAAAVSLDVQQRDLNHRRST
jgi:hypothetical protein